jgi:glycosyltransferase involved in cell wall biosynthesis
MNILFIHQNFPGQFKYLAPALAALGHRVVAMTMQKTGVKVWKEVEISSYSAMKGSTPQVHPWVADFETKVIRAEACFKAALQLKAKGFFPDVVVAHHGWGESIFIKDVWPQTKLGIYCEFFYHSHGLDVGFDPEFPSSDPADTCRVKLKNLNNLLHFGVANAGISPTHWQASLFPEPFKSQISVVHDGIDTDFIVPNSDVTLTIKNNNDEDVKLAKEDEVITFVSRNLEPYRGYHIFMRALPHLLKAKPNARVLIVGADSVSYGAHPDEKKYGASKWKDVFINEVRTQISDEDWHRVHFLGHVSYSNFITLLQLSTVHIYLTYPFVLSWSLIEAMSAGCAIVASDTPPVKEVIAHNETGVLINFFDSQSLVNCVVKLLDNPHDRQRLGINARKFAQKNYDLKQVCLPQQINWVTALAG